MATNHIVNYIEYKPVILPAYETTNKPFSAATTAPSPTSTAP